MPGSSKNFLVAGIGELMWDIYPQARYPGGAPANIVWHAQQLGDRGLLISRVGRDEEGRELLRELQRRHMEINFVQWDSTKSTSRVEITLDAEGVPHYHGYSDVAFDELAFTQELAAIAPQVQAVVFGTLAQRTETARQAILQFLQAAGRALKVFDLGYAHADPVLLAHILPAALQFADVVKMNVAEMEAVRRVLGRGAEPLDELMRFLIAHYNLKLVAVTLGAKGCELFSRDETCVLPGWPLRALDTTGAGDAFTAGLLHQFLRGAPLREIGEFANLMGAYLCTQKGATPIFDVQMLQDFRQSLPGK